jgi:hypothetical protein
MTGHLTRSSPYTAIVRGVTAGGEIRGQQRNLSCDGPVDWIRMATLTGSSVSGMRRQLWKCFELNKDEPLNWASAAH